MEKTKHTPGPWAIQDDHGKRWIESTPGNDNAICEIHRRDTGSKHRKVSAIDDEEFQANARLISAAPELLEALQGLLDSICNPESGEIDRKLSIGDARAAIAKATGA